MKYQLAAPSNYEGQINDEASMTVPDQTMSIRTILEKYARGENFNQKVPIFTDENDENLGIDIKRLDLSEIAELKRQNDEEIRKMQDELGQKRADKAAKERDEAIQSAAKRIVEENAKRGKEAPKTDEPI